MEKCVEEGLVKDIGLSNFNSEQIQTILDNCKVKPANNQVSLKDQSFDNLYIAPNANSNLLKIIFCIVGWMSPILF